MLAFFNYPQALSMPSILATNCFRVKTMNRINVNGGFVNDGQVEP